MGILEQTIQKAIAEQSANLMIKQIVTGTVVKVEGNVCEVSRKNAPTLYDVRLNAINAELDSFVTVIPKEKSFVLVGIIENLKTEAVVLRCSEVEKVNIKIGEQTLDIDKAGFVFNGGNNKGMILVDKLSAEIEKLNTAISTIKTATSTGFKVVDGLAPGTSIAFDTATAAIQAANLSGVTNENIIQ